MCRFGNRIAFYPGNFLLFPSLFGLSHECLQPIQLAICFARVFSFPSRDDDNFISSKSVSFYLPFRWHTLFADEWQMKDWNVTGCQKRKEMNKIPGVVSKYVRTHFRDGFLRRVTPYRTSSGQSAFSFDVVEDNVMYHLKITKDGQLISRETEPLFEEDYLEGGFYTAED